MKVYLERVEAKTIFTSLNPIKVEPLELMYIETMLKESGQNVVFEETNDFDVAILTCYNVAEKELLNRAARLKRINPSAKIIAGGLHVQNNPASFENKCIDFVAATSSLNCLRELLKSDFDNFKGFNKITKEGVEYSEKVFLDNLEDYMPSRSYFEKNKKMLYYLDKRETSLVKTGIGCRYNCSYCYCRLLNGGVFVKPSYKIMVEQVKNVKAKHYWVVDDVFMSNEDELDELIRAVRELNFRPSLIVYMRAESVLKLKNRLNELKECGVDEIIIGFETPSDKELRAYGKGSSKGYAEAIELIKGHNIELMPLFMVRPDYSFDDFRRLWRFLYRTKLDFYTISIFTPLKGTKEYEEQKEELITTDPRKFDFLHAVLPTKLPRILFYTLFYLSHWRLLGSVRFWKILFKR